MKNRRPAIDRKLDRYLRTGETDPLRAAWAGSVLKREARAHADLRGALVREMRQLADGRSHGLLPETDVVAHTRRKVGPMVRGLFPLSEQGAVLATLVGYGSRSARRPNRSPGLAHGGAGAVALMKREASDDAHKLRRGDNWSIDLPPPEGSEPGDRHPFLVLQRDTFNRSAIRTVVGLIITSNTGLASLPGNVLIPSGISGLSKESVVNLSQVLTVDKRVHMAGYVGSLDRETSMRKVESGLRLILDL